MNGALHFHERLHSKVNLPTPKFDACCGVIKRVVTDPGSKWHSLPILSDLALVGPLRVVDRGTTAHVGISITCVLSSSYRISP